MQREYALLRERGAFILRVEAERQTRASRGRLVAETDRTECDLDAMTDWDAVIHNNGDEAELQARLESLLSQLEAIGG